MDRSRMNSLLQTLEKLSGQRLSQRTADDLQQFRYTSAKILQCISGQQDKSHRDVITKNQLNIRTLITALEVCEDATVAHNLVYVFVELLGKTQSSKLCSTFVSHGITQVLFNLLVDESKQSSPSDDLMLATHQLLGKVGHKDRKFGVKARLSQALPVTLGFLRSHYGKLKVLQVILPVMKLYANNAVNASYLGKNSAVSYLFRVLSVCGRKHLTTLKMALDTLVLLVKSKSNSARAIGHGGVPILLTMFQDWHKIDSKNKHIALRKAILNVLKHITNLKSGRKAFINADGIRILYGSCQEILHSRELETVIYISSLIMRKCFPKNRLPVNIRSTLMYPLPQSDFHIPEHTVVAEGDDNNDDDNSSVDNDDDISSDDDNDQENKESEIEDFMSRVPVFPDIFDREFENMQENEVEAGPLPPSNRSPDDLRLSYDKFFPELFEFEVQSDYDDDEDDDYNKPIVVPTVTSDTGFSQSYRHYLPKKSHSEPVLEGMSGEYRYAMNNFNNDDLVREQLNGLTLQNKNGFEDNGRARYGARSPSRRSARERQALAAEDSDSNVHSVRSKSGAVAFTLDISPTRNSRRNRRISSAKRRSKLSKKSKGASASIKTTNTDDNDENIDWLTQNPSMSITRITPLPAYPVLDDESDSSSIGSGQDSPPDNNEDTELFKDIASRTISVGRFNKLAHPEYYGARPVDSAEPIYNRKFGVQRKKIFEDIERMINPEQCINQVVYDVETAIHLAGGTYTNDFSKHTNCDEERILNQADTCDQLRFNAQFESGNLRKAIQIRQYEYDLILNSDINTNHHHQWFYFEVSNMEAGKKYRFNIINCEKLNSQFNFGMKPVMYSVKDALQGRPYWLRVGSEICYYKNHFMRSAAAAGGAKGKTYFTSTFTVKFKYDKDICYLAYHYPYTYSTLQLHLHKWESSYDSQNIYFRNQVLTQTLSGNNVNLLTITSYPESQDRDGIEQFRNRPYIFLSGRVHPAESNSSWVMKGTIQYLLSDKPKAQALRDMYIFKIVPMLNPDGVLNGNHRCSLVGEDLNRRWLHPCPKLHPPIYHTKGLLQYLRMINKIPVVYCDYHGHSRRKNVFLYGCSPQMSWMVDDTNNPTMGVNKVEDTSYKTLPRLLNNTPFFSEANCSFMVEKSKETCARVVVWREMGVIRSYTMESTYCGCDQGPYRGLHMGPREFEEMGKRFCEALLNIRSRRGMTKSASGASISSSRSNPLLPTNQAGPDTDPGSHASDAAEGYNSDVYSDTDSDRGEELDDEQVDSLEDMLNNC